MTMFFHFFCLCPLSITIELNFDISKVAYWYLGFLFPGRAGTSQVPLVRDWCGVPLGPPDSQVPF